MRAPKPKRSGYRLERVYVAEQAYRVLDPESIVHEEKREREVSFGWDWRPVGPRRFEVLIEVDLEPTTDAPEEASVRLLGIYSASVGELSIAFTDFIRANAPAILFPYAREVISTMTGRGPFGAFHIDPLNLRAVMGKMPLTETSGHKLLTQSTTAFPGFELYEALEVEGQPDIAPAKAHDPSINENEQAES